MKRNMKLTLAVVSLILGACAQPPMTNRKVQYQVKSAQVLSKYAGSISKGFTSSKQSTSKKFYYDSGYDQNYTQWNQQNKGYIIRQAMEQEVQDCVELTRAVPKNCGNLRFMAGSLARCLDRIVSYRNPLYTHAFRNMDKRGQNYWSYLLDYRRPRPIEYFGTQDFNMFSGYASQGYVDNDMFE